MKIIETKENQCVDCYKCVRNCEVKAIKVEKGNTQIIEERCILDGKCLQVCPQTAKKIISDINEVKELVKNNKNVIASIAPSFIASFSDYDYTSLLDGIKSLGFKDIENTSIAANYLLPYYKNHINNSTDYVINSDCPSVVNLIEKHYPQYCNNLMPLVSPMIAHCRLLKKGFKQYRNLDIKVVFIGPCVAKIDEAENSDIDGVITFEDLKEWFSENDITPVKTYKNQNKLENDINKEILQNYSTDYGFINNININQKSISITGFKRCKDFFNNISQSLDNIKIIEMLMCDSGCINGPAVSSDLSLVKRMDLIYSHIFNKKPSLFDYSKIDIDVERIFTDKSFYKKLPTENEIQNLMKKIGKYSKEDELNCGACGYNSCREKIIAVYQGMAELEMCMPYMKKKAELKADMIISKASNGVLVFDNLYNIIEYNNSFKKLFKISEKIKGKKVENIIGNPFNNKIHSEEGKEIYSFQYNNNDVLKNFEVQTFGIEENTFVAIFIDTTHRTKNKEKMREIKQKTLAQTKEVINKQMRVVQEIAGLLGETTAESKVSLLKLIEIMKEEDDY